MKKLPIEFRTIVRGAMPTDIAERHQLVATLTNMPIGGVIAMSMLEYAITAGQVKTSEYISAQRLLMTLAGWVGTHRTFSAADKRLLGASLLALSSFATTKRVPLAIFEHGGLEGEPDIGGNSETLDTDEEQIVNIPRQSRGLYDVSRSKRLDWDANASQRTGTA